MPATARRRVLVVLGMHRGGTSAVAGTLHRLGVDFGPRLMPANADNPAGYYEHNDVVNLHDRFLGRLGASWDDPFPPEFDANVWPDLAPAPGLPSYREELIAILRRDFADEDGRPPAPLWGLKDPRLCLLLPWWEPLWAALGSEPIFVIVLRSPEAVAASLGRRDGFSTGKSNLLWLQHLLRAERYTRGHCRCFVDYDNFLTDWRATVERLGSTWSLSWPRSPGSLTPGRMDFLDPGLRHHQPPRPGATEEKTPRLVWIETVRSVLFPDGKGELEALDRTFDELTRARWAFAAAADHFDSDFAIQLQAQRGLTRWYEEEWQKALAESKTLESRLTKREEKVQSLLRRSGPTHGGKSPKSPDNPVSQ